eukprot:768581-Hanusia_phi.AAC.2
MNSPSAHPAPTLAASASSLASIDRPSSFTCSQVQQRRLPRQTCQTACLQLGWSGGASWLGPCGARPVGCQEDVNGSQLLTLLLTTETCWGDAFLYTDERGWIPGGEVEEVRRPVKLEEEREEI